MKVVLDTNIFISGIHWHGIPGKIIDNFIEQKFQIITSKGIIQELIRVLINFKIPLNVKKILWWLEIIKNNSILVQPKIKLNIIKDDPDDNKFIEAALEGNAKYIVSQDKHLLKIKQYKNIKIITPKHFLEKITT